MSTIDQLVENIFAYDMTGEVKKISSRTRSILQSQLRRRGLVIAISGGIDSSVSAALSVEAMGADKVFGLLLPEKDSSSKSLTRGKMLADHLGIEYRIEDIAPSLKAIGCYSWRDEAIKKTFPQYGEGWKNKIAIAGGGEGKINHFKLIVADPDGNQFAKRLALKEYLQIVAATNFKQRIRKTIEFFHADRLNYAVVGTPNRMEYDQGFFVKNGDGAADIKPIAHLYKTQVYMMAKHLGLPGEICGATPTTDTYSLAQGQDEFYYALPYKEMDIALWHLNNHKAASELGEKLGITTQQAEYYYTDIENKRRTTASLHWPALTLQKIDGPVTSPPVEQSGC